MSLLSHVPNLTSEQAATLVLTVGLTAPSASSAIPGVLDLVTAAERVVVSNLGSFPPKAIRAFLSCFMRGFYSKDLLEALVRKGMQEGWELWQMSLLLQGCLRAKYATPELSEYVAERVVKEAGTVSDDSRVSIVVFAQAAAACPKNAPTFREAGQVLALCRDKLHLAQLAVPHLFVSTAVSLASLHCYPKEVLDVAFSEEFLSKARFKGALPLCQALGEDCTAKFGGLLCQKTKGILHAPVEDWGLILTTRGSFGVQPKSRLRGVFSLIGFCRIVGTLAKIQTCHPGICGAVPCLGDIEVENCTS